jgi:hypothetical protein
MAWWCLPFQWMLLNSALFSETAKSRSFVMIIGSGLRQSTLSKAKIKPTEAGGRSYLQYDISILNRYLQKHDNI